MTPLFYLQFLNQSRQALEMKVESMNAGGAGVMRPVMQTPVASQVRTPSFHIQHVDPLLYSAALLCPRQVYETGGPE